MKTTYNLSSKFILSVFIFFLVNTISGQCSYDINARGTNDLVNWSEFHISNVQIDGDNSTSEINNSNSFISYSDFTGVSVDMTAGNTYNFSILNDKAGYPWGNMKIRIWIDYNNDGNYTQVYDSGGYVDSWPNTTHTISGSFTVDASASTGTARLRIQGSYHTSDGSMVSSDGCDFTNTYRGDVEDYTINISASSTNTMGITGSGNTITSGSTTTSVGNSTNFGAYDIDVAPLENIYTITNNNATNLTLTLPITDPSGIFTITDQPDNAIIAPGNSETFTVAFDPTAETNYSATVSVASNDPSTPNYTFTVEGEGTQIYPDTDGDGIPDTLDGDDDNDGILDAEEQLFCISSPTRKTTDVVFLNEDFGAGTTRETIAGAAYCFEDGTGSCHGSINLNDGSYVSYYQAANGDGINDTPNGEVASWADDVWYPGLDHTPGDTNGRMAMFNAENTSGAIFYETTISGVTAGVDVTYGFSIINLDRADYPCIDGCPGGVPWDDAPRTRPSVLMEIIDPVGTVIASTSSGLIQPTSNYVTGDWTEVSATFNSIYTEFTVRLTNENPGGIGNDLAIDDIFAIQTLCDIDEDGVADAADLDNDDDGIPNVVELGFSDPDKDGTLFGTGWVDSNRNGVHDSYETPPASYIDTDNDGVPDYLDPDSDNDGIFDTVEYDGKGDVDITGNGVGDGSDSEDFISKIDNDDADGDGILAIIDTNDDDADGNDFGTSYADPLDDDADGIPNYRDVDSADDPNDFSNGSDIDTTIYAALDADNNGDIDGTTDTDQDGILDAFDTDNTVFGSPRSLNDSYTVFFDGRNDYIAEASVMSGWTNATLMAWIKIESGASGDRVITGQNNFNLMVTSGGTIRATANSTTLDGSALAANVWVHVGAVYNSTDGELVLYINGKEAASAAISGNLPVDTSSFTLGRTPDTDSNYFEGEIDEVRVFTKALTEDELQRMVYQELSTAEQGSVIAVNISGALTGTLSRYYKMDTYNDDVISNMASGATMYNIKDIYFQTAPLPYETVADGNWTDASTWLHGDVWDITSKQNNSDDTSIVHIKHNTTLDGSYNTQGMIGLLVDSGIELTVPSNKGLYNNWYLKLDGTIDLEGESQLIQTENSSIDGSSIGNLERDQQGTENRYTYNYWSSPVHSDNPDAAIDGDETYTIADVLLDGEDPDNPESIDFIGGSNYNGNNTTSPIQIADYWIWKYTDSPSDDYSQWQQVRSTGVLNVGEGYTMKGPDTGAITGEKNYVFKGIPNNGEITCNIATNNDYLVGNPYPSAIDANAFILDNIGTADGGTNTSGNIINGALYFWEHFGGGSHFLKDYIGGYATYTLMGGAPAVSNDAIINANGNIGTKTPERYIPVGQGFFVSTIQDNSLEDDSEDGVDNDPDLTQPIVGGDIVFKNSQRDFKTESADPSLFLKGTHKKAKNQSNKRATDTREKIRLKFNSPDGYHRQLLVGVDTNASSNFDLGYEAILNESNTDDMYWLLDKVQLIIQAVDNFDETQVLPLGIKTKNGGVIEIEIDDLQNIPNHTEIYLKDKQNNSYYDLRTSKYITTVVNGEVNDRFELVFSSENILSNTDTFNTNKIEVFHNKASHSLVIANPQHVLIGNLKLINILGQIVLNKTINNSNDKIEIPVNTSEGIYTAKIVSDDLEFTKKIVIHLD
ncbi:hypothetical protein MHTCC0001_09120 [Flavobacteriaceae bacterium MHTCC 0001]